MNSQQESRYQVKPLPDHHQVFKGCRVTLSGWGIWDDISKGWVSHEFYIYSPVGLKHLPNIFPSRPLAQAYIIDGIPEPHHIVQEDWVKPK